MNYDHFEIREIKEFSKRNYDAYRFNRRSFIKTAKKAVEALENYRNLGKNIPYSEQPE